METRSTFSVCHCFIEIIVVDSCSSSSAVGELEPLPYHRSIRDYLKTQEEDVWRWYASHRVQTKHADSVRFELLKSTYRIDRATQAELYAAAETVAQQLSLDVPITLYQSQHAAGLNASLAYVPREMHLVLHGPIAERLTPSELQALLAHELSHMLLWDRWEGEYFVCNQILAALTRDARAETEHFESARLFDLYTEIFCDRGALLSVADPLTVISMLVKVSTGATTVSAESFVRQADEVFERGATKTDELTHPEAYIRARALTLWADDSEQADAPIEAMIQGPAELTRLDLIAQTKVSALTRRLIDRYLARPWLQTEPILAHARLFFHNYTPPKTTTAAAAAFAADIKTQDTALRDYYCYVLLDFVTADRELEEMPLAAALVLCEELGWKDRFAEIAIKELRLRKRQFQKIDQKKEELLARA